MKRQYQVLSAIALLALPVSLHAASDLTGDFLPTYTRPQAADLDFTSATAKFDGTRYDLSFTVNGAITNTPGKLWVWGVNRGAGTPRLNILFNPALDPTVLWDSLAVLSADGTLRVVAFPNAGPPAITTIANGATITGNRISTSVPLNLWTSRGFTPEQYTFQLWSRFRANPAIDGQNTEIADFGPRLFAVPEPATWAMMIAGFGAMGGALRAQRRNLAVQ